jgi:hypothetical protein
VLNIYFEKSDTTISLLDIINAQGVDLEQWIIKVKVKKHTVLFCENSTFFLRTNKKKLTFNSNIWRTIVIFFTEEGGVGECLHDDRFYLKYTKQISTKLTYKK